MLNVPKRLHNRNDIWLCQCSAKVNQSDREIIIAVVLIEKKDSSRMRRISRLKQSAKLFIFKLL